MTTPGPGILPGPSPGIILGDSHFSKFFLELPAADYEFPCVFLGGIPYKSSDCLIAVTNSYIPLFPNCRIPYIHALPRIAYIPQLPVYSPHSHIACAFPYCPIAQVFPHCLYCQLPTIASVSRLPWIPDCQRLPVNCQFMFP